MSKFPRFALLAGAVVVAVTTALIPQARANAILAIQNSTGSNLVDLSAIENGSYTIANIVGGSPSAGSVNVLNDTGSPVTNLTLFFNGVTSQGGLSFNFQGMFSSMPGEACTISAPGVSSGATSTGCQTTGTLPTTPEDYKFSITGINPAIGTLSSNDQFQIIWSSFSGTTTGQITGTPLPAALPLFATGIGGLGLLGWRRKRKALAVLPN